jgi:ssRNA-specific RNase YbeY (16S rRNA maturation enzyme)
LAGANLLHLFDFDDFIGEPEKRKKKKEKEMMKMFGIRGERRKK